MENETENGEELFVSPGEELGHEVLKVTSKSSCSGPSNLMASLSLELEAIGGAIRCGSEDGGLQPLAWPV